MTATRRLRPVVSVGLALAVLAVAVVALVARAEPSSAAPRGCRPLPNGNWECDNGSEGETTPPPTEGGGGPNENGGGPGTTGPAPGSCRWENFPDQELMKATYYPEAGPDDVVQYYVCNLGTAENPIWAEPGGNTTTRLATPTEGFGPAPPPMPPAALADMFLINVRAELELPRLVTSPAPGMAAIVDQPTFVAVDNWQGEFTRGPACHTSGTCVSLRLEPHLTYDPGVPGVDPIACAGQGTVYEPDGPEPDVQAAAGCTYAYTARTGIPGRPDAYRAQATVRWTVTWTDVTPGSPPLSGTFPAVDLDSVVLDRQVDEVQGVVVETGDGAG